MAKATKSTIPTPTPTEGDPLAAVAEEKDSLYQFPSGQDLADRVPAFNSPEWSDYVMRQFDEGELVDGCPTVAGLRRVARALIGPVLSSRGFTVQAPAQTASGWQPAVCDYEVVVLWGRDDELRGREVAYRDCAETWEGNCTNPTVSKFRVETSATRAEARCFRKMLGLRAIAAEEKIYPAGEQAAINGAQVLFIETNCRNLGLSVKAFVNAGKRQYDAIEEVPYEAALAMTEQLGRYERGEKAAPPSLMGFKADWRKTFTKSSR